MSPPSTDIDEIIVSPLMPKTAKRSYECLTTEAHPVLSITKLRCKEKDDIRILRSRHHVIAPDVLAIKVDAIIHPLMFYCCVGLYEHGT